MNINYMRQLVKASDSLDDIEKVFGHLILDDFKEHCMSQEDREILWTGVTSSIRNLRWAYSKMFEAMHSEK
jgi:hypothetical protein